MINNNSTYIIAEAGINHNGSIKRALNMVKIAAESKVDAIKFQTFVAKDEISSFSPKAEYQIKNTNSKESQLEMAKKLELNIDDHLVLIKRCKEYNIEFLSSPFDINSIRLLKKLKLKRFKIPSGEITNLPYLREIGKLGKPIILSTGMSTMDEIKIALNILIDSGTKKELVTILHCNTEYPTPMKDVNLKAMSTIRDEIGDISIGYSDHTLGIEIPIAAVAMGAKVIEKHFTLDRSLDGPDHLASLEPEELKKMVKAIRNIDLAMGNGLKKPSPSEIKNLLVARKSIVASKNISKGEIFSEKNLAIKRPGNGISPMDWDKIIGKKSKRDFKFDELIEI